MSEYVMLRIYLPLGERVQGNQRTSKSTAKQDSRSKMHKQQAKLYCPATKQNRQATASNSGASSAQGVRRDGRHRTGQAIPAAPDYLVIEDTDGRELTPPILWLWTLKGTIADAKAGHLGHHLFWRAADPCLANYWLSGDGSGLWGLRSSNYPVQRLVSA